MVNLRMVSVLEPIYRHHDRWTNRKKISEQSEKVTYTSKVTDIFHDFIHVK